VTRLIRFAVLALVTIVTLALLVANRHFVTLYLDPLSPRSVATAIEPPLFLVILLVMITGVCLGAFAVWISQGRWRRQAKLRAAESIKLKRSLALLEVELAETKKARPTMTAKVFGSYQGLTH